MSTDVQPLALKPHCDAKTLSELADVLKNMEAGPVELDAEGLSAMSSSCLQLIISADNTFGDDGPGVTLKNMSSELQDSLSLLGVDPKRFENEGTE